MYRYSHKPNGGIPTQMQTLLQWLRSMPIQHKLDVTKNGNWYVKLSNHDYNIMPTRSPGNRGYRLVATEGGTIDGYSSKDIHRLLERITKDSK
jgi:hypothetical protein